MDKPTGAWNINGNAAEGTLNVNVDAAGNVTGNVYGQTITGFWDADAQKITFVRVPNPLTPDKIQVFTGYGFVTTTSGGLRSTLAGSFEAFKGTGANANRVLFGWYAHQDAIVK